MGMTGRTTAGGNAAVPDNGYRVQRWNGGLDDAEPLDNQLGFQDRRLQSVEGAQIDVERSGVGRVRGSAVTLSQSGAGMALARDLRVEQSGGVMLVGGKLTVQQSGAQWLVGGLVQAKQVFAITVIAARVEGQVKCLFDARGAFAFGAGFALVGGLMRLLLFRRR